MREKEYDKPKEEELIIGRNAVFEALSSRSIHSILVTKGDSNSSFQMLISKAKELDVPIKVVDSHKLDTLCHHGKHQGIVAVAAAYSYSSLEDILRIANQKELFLVIADQIEDPHNLGAIIRTAECAGAHGVLIPKRRSAGLSFTVGKTSAGAIAHIPVARVANLAQTLDKLKQKGIWIYGTDMQGVTWCEVDLRGPIALVVGNEGHGISRLLKEKCDMLLSLPLYGKISSLNASVATGIFLYEIARQRAGITAK